MHHRIIARLDIKGPNLVKGIHLEGLRLLGNPEDFAEYYYRSGADELMYTDIVASLYNRNSLHDIIARTAKKIFIPLTVGGGLRSLDDIRAVLRAGADKVSLNTAAVKNPDLIREAALKFGSSTIVVSIEAKKQPDGSYEAYIDNGREKTGIEAIGWARRVVELGAGELVVTSIDREGTGQGYDLALTQKIADAVSVPVIACGGAGKRDDVRDAILTGHADAVCVASLLHYNALRTGAVAGHHHTDFGTGSPFRQGSFSKIQDMNIADLKAYLVEHGILCRTLAHAPPTLHPQLSMTPSL